VRGGREPELEGNMKVIWPEIKTAWQLISGRQPDKFVAKYFLGFAVYKLSLKKAREVVNFRNSCIYNYFEK
jgi:hypothetical protein